MTNILIVDDGPTMESLPYAVCADGKCTVCGCKATREWLYKVTDGRLERNDLLCDAHDTAAALKAHGVVRETPKVGRNEPCPCNKYGKKFKKCCGRLA